MERDWLSDKEKFVAFWVDENRHFGNCTTNRAESEHALLKSYLKGKAIISRFIDIIDKIVRSQLTSIKHAFDVSRSKCSHDVLAEPILYKLKYKVAQTAMDMLYAEVVYSRTLVRQSDCGCQLSRAHGMPCACQLVQINGRRGQYYDKLSCIVTIKIS